VSRGTLKEESTLFSMEKEVKITLDIKFQTFFCICDEYVINFFVCIYEIINGTLKNYLTLVLKLCYHYDILQNRLEYYTERWFKCKTKYYSVEKNVFSRIILFRNNIYNVN